MALKQRAGKEVATSKAVVDAPSTIERIIPYRALLF